MRSVLLVLASVLVAGHLASGRTSGLGESPRICGDADGAALTRQAVQFTLSGQVAGAESAAKLAIQLIEKSCSPTDPVLIEPLYVLTAARFEKGMLARARESLARMKSIQTDRPDQRALVCEMSAMLLHAEGKWTEAEAEYFAASRALEEGVPADSASVGSVFNGLGVLYLEEGRFDDAQTALDRAITIFGRARDATPADLLKALDCRAALNVRRHNWHGAEQDLRDAVSIADHERLGEVVTLKRLLNDYAKVLRKDHRAREARSIEVRASALQGDYNSDCLVDVTQLAAHR
jgi:tetratricopeptide (TPR) repeat protein